jgi:hypothetical protein
VVASNPSQSPRLESAVEYQSRRNAVMRSTPRVAAIVEALARGGWATGGWLIATPLDMRPVATVLRVADRSDQVSRVALCGFGLVPRRALGRAQQ